MAIFQSFTHTINHLIEMTSSTLILNETKKIIISFCPKMMNESKSWSQILDIVREKKVAAYQY